MGRKVKRRKNFELKEHRDALDRFLEVFKEPAIR